MSEETLSETEYGAITDAAAHWCMRLHASDCTVAERQAFEQWRNAHPLHAFKYTATTVLNSLAQQPVKR
ncbi:hypothetical protein BK659_08970 [Pseudomonas brassicacearum]|uniref:FecR N-terminal domain-containing protein n=1 Tax=Pseudomonas brassicacearum TaxID=930166 RepID=A0A423H9Z6_9PSED|nr:hypothetical protein BK659_08970 [Pseudomonas brassicacearum]